MRLSKREFRDFVYKVIGNMAGGHEHFDYFIDFLLNSVEVKLYLFTEEFAWAYSQWAIAMVIVTLLEMGIIVSLGTVSTE